MFIAENEEGLGTLFKELLEINGYNVLALAKNNEEVLDKCESLTDDPNLYILEHNIPLLNGYDTSSAILKKNPKAKILFLSENPDFKNKFQGGNFGLLLKPFQLSTFLDAVNCMVKDSVEEAEKKGSIMLFRNGKQ